MVSIKTFVFNPFQENTFLLYDESRECIVIDPGNYYPEEHREMLRFFREEKLTPVQILNTHCHIDHILGNSWFFNEYKIKTAAHRADEPLLQGAEGHGQLFGIETAAPPPIGKYLEENDTIPFGKSTLHCIHVPGHSPGSLAYYCREQDFVIVGDVLFQGGIGRTDLPGGDYDMLIHSITGKLFNLGDHVVVYPGHGEETTIGNEKRFNPFFA